MKSWLIGALLAGTMGSFAVPAVAQDNGGQERRNWRESRAESPPARVNWREMRAEQPRPQSEPRQPRAEAPRMDMPRSERPRSEMPRAERPQIDQPRTESPWRGARNEEAQGQWRGQPRPSDRRTQPDVAIGQPQVRGEMPRQNWREYSRTRDNADRGENRNEDLRRGEWRQDQARGEDRQRGEWRQDQARRDDRRRDDWRNDDRRRNDNWRDGDRRRDGDWRRDNDWRVHARLNDRDRWRDQRRWNHDWRNSARYDWNRYRHYNAHLYRLPRYYAPYGWSYGYRRFSIGVFLNDILWSDRYWINDPWSYRLPPAYGALRWVRYYDDALLVDIRDGYVVDVIHNVFW